MDRYDDPKMEVFDASAKLIISLPSSGEKDLIPFFPVGSLANEEG